MSRVTLSPPPYLSPSPSRTHISLCRSMKSPNLRWWKRALGQRISWPGLASFLTVITRDPHLALPHAAVADIRSIDWAELSRLGFKGVVFDKDNTLTAPYSAALWPPLASSLRCCRSAFPGRIAVFSNSAGLYQYDPDGVEARAVEEAIGGVHVIRHEMKKPAGTAEEIEKYFGCSSSLLVMVGDRNFTDVVYGNRNGFLTILTKPLSRAREPFIVRLIRKLEGYLVDRWDRKGLRPKKHKLLFETGQFIKAPKVRRSRWIARRWRILRRLELKLYSGYFLDSQVRARDGAGNFLMAKVLGDEGSSRGVQATSAI